MSHYMTALAMKQTGLKPAAKIVLYWLADHYNGETGLCFPSLKKLADECEMDKSTIVRHLKALEEAGLIQRQARTRANGSQTSTSYLLHLTPVAERDSPCSKTQQTPVAKCDPHNLVINNLVNVTSYTFDDAWAAYPRKVGKGAARKAWGKAVAKVSPDVLSAKLAEYVDSLAGTDPRYTPHLATWLNGERWEDTIEKRQQSGFRSMVAELAMGGE